MENNNIKVLVNEIQNRIDYRSYNGILYQTDNIDEFFEKKVFIDGTKYPMEDWIRALIRMFNLRGGDFVYIPYGGIETYGIFEKLELKKEYYNGFDDKSKWIYTPIIHVKNIFYNNTYFVYEFYEYYQEFDEQGKLKEFTDKLNKLYSLQEFILKQ